MTSIVGTQQLDSFRNRWDGPRLLDLVADSSGRVFIGWPVGVGKSRAIDGMIEAAIGEGRYDLVVALSPTRRVLEERAWARDPPSGVKVVNLRPRPRGRCGGLDAQWRIFEQANMSALGRERLCGRCAQREGCYWPGQYGAGLRGTRALFATHAHLARAPDFLTQLAAWAGATRVLTLIDEVGFAAASFRRRVVREDLERFVEVLKSVSPDHENPRHHGWGYTARLLLGATTEDLRSPDWRMPPSRPDWALPVQAAGWAAHGERFRFVAHELQQFGRSPLESRERHADGDLSFAAPPSAGGDFAVFSGTAQPEWLRFRLGRDIAAPFAGHRFDHPGSVWINIASRSGMKAYFPSNADQVLDFFAGLVSKRLTEGRRPLLVAKECFVGLCSERLSRALREIHPTPVRILTGDWDDVSLSAPDVVPLIHFGLIGTNLFERFDCAFALTGYYVNEEIVNQILQDVPGTDGRVRIVVRTEGSPARRRAHVADRRHRYCDANRLAQFALDQQEMDVVLQAVGRVRPHTSPREIITFQCAAHPSRPYDREFSRLEEARQHFGIPTRRDRGRGVNRMRVIEARREGMSQSEAASRLGLGISTVKRHWNAARPGGIADPS